MKIKSISYFQNKISAVNNIDNEKLNINDKLNEYLEYPKMNHIIIKNNKLN